MTPVQWLICVIAALGFAFDSYELLMLPLIVRPALAELLGVAPNSLAVNDWVGTMQYVPAVAGGIFGLLGGYLTDLFGRRRVLVWSILLYAFSALFAGYSTSVYELLFWRCCTFVGVCVEFVAAVAWLAELFDDPKRREKVIGYTQAFGSIGGLMVTGAYYLIVTYEMSFPLIRGEQIAWRYTLISGLIPAIPLILIRPFLPESPAWMAKKRAGTLKRPSFGELFAPEFRTTTIVTTVMMACVYAAAFGAIQQMPRIVPGLEEVRALERTAQEQTISVRAVVPGIRRAGRARAPGRSGGGDRRPPPAAVSVPDSGPVHPAGRVFPGAVGGAHAGAVGHLRGRPGHHLADELLGELPAARLPDALARHRRELRRQRRRADDRHLRGADHHLACHLDAGRRRADPPLLCGWNRWHHGVRDRGHRQQVAAGAQGRAIAGLKIEQLPAVGADYRRRLVPTVGGGW